MERKKYTWWNYRKYDREPGRGNVIELGRCLAAIDTSFEGISSANNAGKVCWAETRRFSRRDLYKLHNTHHHDSYRTDQAFRLALEL